MITLATLPQATAQEVFDQVVVHLITQGVQSLDRNDFSCVYRNPTGLKCAAGCLIADSEYKSILENKPWNILADNNEVPTTHQYLIRRLQSVHDNWTVNNPLLYGLRRVATNCDLDPSVIETTLENLE